MRLGRTRLAVACVVGSVMVGLSAPAAWATKTPEPTTTPTGTATPTVESSIQAPDPETVSPTATPTIPAVPTPTAGTTGASQPPAQKLDLSKILPSGLPGIPLEMLDDLIALIPAEDLPDLSELIAQPLALNYNCGANGPVWKVTNTGNKAYGYGWFDTTMNGNYGAIAPGEVVTLETSAEAVFAVPFDIENGEFVPAIPAIGYSPCPGAPAPTAPATPVSLPAATTATPVVTDNVNYTG